MPQYEFEGTSPSDAPTRGVLQAATLEDARGQLIQQGVTRVTVREVTEDSGEKLSQQEAEDLAGVVTTLSNSQLALSPGLRAAAQEATSPRLARALHAIANQLDDGATLDDIMVRQSHTMPAHVRMLVVAAARSGHLASVLADLIDFHRDIRLVWREIRAALAYPLLVLMISAALLVVVQLFVATPFIEVFESMEFELPPVTKSIKWWTSRGIYLAGYTVVVVIVLAIILRFAGGAARWSRMLSTAPLFGALFHLSAAAEFTHLLSILLKHDMPLPNALRLTASGMQNANLADASAQYARGAEDGASLSEMLRSSQRTPASLTPLVAWGERTGELPDALATARDMFKQRIKLRAALLRSVLPPALFLMIGALLMVFVLSLAAPAIGFARMLM